MCNLIDLIGTVAIAREEKVMARQWARARWLLSVLAVFAVEPTSAGDLDQFLEKGRQDQKEFSGKAKLPSVTGPTSVPTTADKNRGAGEQALKNLDKELELKSLRQIRKELQ